MHPGGRPGPALRQAWDRRAWAGGRPDEVVPRPGADVTGRWLGELADLGYRDRNAPVVLVAAPVGRFDRDAAAAIVSARLAAARSAWNAADLRGGVEQLIAAAGVVADASVRLELAEYVTARVLASCVTLAWRDGGAVPVPEHIRSWTSGAVLKVEADLTARLAARGAADAALTQLVRSAVARSTHAGQAAAVTCSPAAGRWS